MKAKKKVDGTTWIIYNIDRNDDDSCVITMTTNDDNDNDDGIPDKDITKARFRFPAFREALQLTGGTRTKQRKFSTEITVVVNGQKIWVDRGRAFINERLTKRLTFN